jgi:hypothetical protein
VHSEHSSSSHSIHQLTDVLTILRLWQGSQIVAVADSASNGAKHSQLFFDCQEQLTGIRQTYKSMLKYREENASGIKDDKQRITENVKKIKERLIIYLFFGLEGRLVFLIHVQR